MTEPSRDVVPPLAWLLGLGGLLPFVASAATPWLMPDWADLARLSLVGYGATILAFLGAVHWGLALRAPPDEAWATPWRLGLGVVPALIGWVALLLAWRSACFVLAAAILATAAVETRASASRLVPAAYVRLRWTLSLGAAACLVAGALT